ncbi:endolytic peptidoglycan transglycosylase RlpA [Dryocola clanedunensis]
MVKYWPGIFVAAAILAGCSSGDDEQQQVPQQPQPAVCNGPIVEISGAEPRYEVPNPSVNQDYENNGKSYKIVQNPTNFSQTGLAAIYDAEPGSNLTASGEPFDAMAITAAHPTLPVPSYARITNLANGRMIVVRINDRGPYGNDRVISLSRASADRLNTSNNTKVRIDPIIVAQDGTMSGPGTACTTIAKQTYALPARPDLNTGMGSVSSAPADAPQGDVRAISNSTLQPADATGAPVSGSGFLGAATPLASGVVETNEPEATPAAAAPVAATPAATQSAAPVAAGTQAAPVTAPGSVQGSTQTAAPAAAPAAAAAATGRYVVQVGAVSDKARATQWQQKLSQQFGVPGAVSSNGAVYRVQLGPFGSRSEAAALQQRLMSEAQQQSFITNAPAM